MDRNDRGGIRREGVKEVKRVGGSVGEGMEEMEREFGGGGNEGVGGGFEEDSNPCLPGHAHYQATPKGALTPIPCHHGLLRCPLHHFHYLVSCRHLLRVPNITIPSPPASPAR